MITNRALIEEKEKGKSSNPRALKFKEFLLDPLILSNGNIITIHEGYLSLWGGRSKKQVSYIENKEEYGQDNWAICVEISKDEILIFSNSSIRLWNLKE